MEVVSQPDGKPFVVDTDEHRGHSRGSFGYSDGVWAQTAERVKDSQALQSAELNNRFFGAQDTQAGISKDVAVLSRDVVISEGRTAVQLGTITKDIALLNRDMALTEARLTLVAAQNAAAAAECCCELKALVLEQNGATRLLIKDNLIESLKDQIAALRVPTAA